MENKIKRLVEKSIEAFIMGVEIYNKPTIKYRIEGFSFFICNAWELMLKAELLNREVSIYYENNPSRTINLSETVKKIYSDQHTRIRLNLEKIIDLRNISTHFITEDYEFKFAPLFQACVINFIEEINRFHEVDITEYIAQNFLTISASLEPLTNEEIRVKYSPEIAERFIQEANEIDVLTKELDSEKFSIQVTQNFYITRKKDNADFIIKIDKKATASTQIIKDLKDPADTHKYSHSNVVKAVKERLNRQNIKLGYEKGFNKYVLDLIISFYHIKFEPKYAYKHVVGNNETFTYSQQFVEFIVSEIKKNPKKFVKSIQKKITPGT